MFCIPTPIPRLFPAHAIDNLNFQAAFLLSRDDMNPSAFPTAGDAMHDCILDEWLQDQLGTNRVRAPVGRPTEPQVDLPGALSRSP